MITRQALKREKLVYVAVANKSQRYPRGRSSIVYIGTTKKGVGRIAASAAGQARKLLSNHGVRRLHLFVVSCTSLRGVETWKKLESGLLMAFKDLHWSVPVGNTQGKNREWRDERDYFSENRLKNIIRELSTRAS